jgi:hypothetical protein
LLDPQVIQAPLGNHQGRVSANRGRRLPVVRSREEFRPIFSSLGCVPLLVWSLPSGARRRLPEALRLGAKKADYLRQHIRIHAGKAPKNWVTVAPAALREPLRANLDYWSGG